MRRYLFVVLIIILIGATYLTSFFVKKERFADENLRLKRENENLKAQIQGYSISNLQSLASNSQFISAKVFSTYPFNIKNQITINVGENQGVKKNMTVIFGENILIGQITEVFKDYSVVRTIFDPNWQVPIRIGKEEINGLFKGGNEPQVILIEKEKQIQIGDIVYMASQEFPYGLKIGEIAEIKETAAGVFKEAILKIPFNVSELREVNIVK